jgi:hypothetical protein
MARELREVRDRLVRLAVSAGLPVTVGGRSYGPARLPVVREAGAGVVEAVGSLPCPEDVSARRYWRFMRVPESWRTAAWDADPLPSIETVTLTVERVGGCRLPNGRPSAWRLAFMVGPGVERLSELRGFQPLDEDWFVEYMRTGWGG